jgi:hypothetical protein
MNYSEECSAQSGRLMSLVENVELFHTPDRTAYGTITVDGHHETWPLGSTFFEQWVTREFYKSEASTPNPTVFKGVLETIRAKAQFDGQERSVFTRVGALEGKIYVDLGDPAWRAVEVTNSGWSVVTDPPVRFRRSNGMMALAMPEHGGHISNLRRFVNVKDDDWVLFVSWLVAAFRPKGPYPILGLYGEHGSAKTTTERVARDLIDPFKAPMRTKPQNERDLMISASNSHILTLDNLSYVDPWLSDALCRLSTGGGLATRALYKDDEEKIFDAQRPILLNGIGEVAVNGDLLDRMVILSLPEINENERKEEAVFWEDFQAVKPQILGALLSGVSAALKNVKVVKLDKKPRMADFAIWASAAECGLGFAAKEFINAYNRNRREAGDVALEASPVATKVYEFMQDKNEWEGTTGELNNKANIQASSPKALSNALERVKPSLRNADIIIHRLPRQAGRRLLRIEKKPTAPSVPSLPSQTQSIQQVPRDDSRDDGCGRDTTSSEVCAGLTENGRKLPRGPPILQSRTYGHRWWRVQQSSAQSGDACCAPYLTRASAFCRLEAPPK